MGNEVVRYNNAMNQIKFKDFTPMDYNFMMALCCRVRDKGTSEVVLTFSEIKTLSNYSTKNDNSRFISDLQRMNKKLMSVAFSYETDDEIVMFSLFNTFRISRKAKTLTVNVNEQFTFILNGLVDNFTRFDLMEFSSLKSRYSKALYRLLKQWKGTGKYIVRFDDLRNIMDVPKSMKNNAVNRDILTPMLEELKHYFGNLQMIIERDESRRGKPFTNCVFLFDSAKRIAAKEYEVVEETETRPVIKSLSIEQLIEQDLQMLNSNN